MVTLIESGLANYDSIGQAGSINLIGRTPLKYGGCKSGNEHYIIILLHAFNLVRLR